MLRKYQNRAIDDINLSFKTNRKILFKLPTGGGKTTIFSELCRDKRVLILVHRDMLVDQIVNRLYRIGISAGIIKAGVDPNPARAVQVASVQSAVNRNLPSGLDLIVIDEAHHASASTYIEILDKYPTTKILGVTATPYRTDNRGLGSVFETLVHGTDICTLIEYRYLCWANYIVGQCRGDGGVIGSIYESWAKHARYKKTIIFAQSVGHSLEICDEFNKNGIPAAHLSAQVRDEERDLIIKQFQEGTVQVLTNYGIVTEGFDVPAVEAVVIARSTKSQALYIQMVGRALRPSDNKEFAVVIDHGGCYERFGAVEVCDSNPVDLTVGVVDAETASEISTSDSPEVEVRGIKKLKKLETHKFVSGLDALKEAKLRRETLKKFKDFITDFNDLIKIDDHRSAMKLFYEAISECKTIDDAEIFCQNIKRTDGSYFDENYWTFCRISFKEQYSLCYKLMPKFDLFFMAFLSYEIKYHCKINDDNGKMIGISKKYYKNFVMQYKLFIDFIKKQDDCLGINSLSDAEQYCQANNYNKWVWSNIKLFCDRLGYVFPTKYINTEDLYSVFLSKNRK